MQEAQPAVYRLRWIPLLAGFAVIALLGTLAIQSLTPQQAASVVPPTVGPLQKVELNALGISMIAPSAWKPPTVLDANRFVLSPDGSTDTRTTAGPFLYVVVDALNLFKQQLTFRTDLDDPQAQLNALVDALNRNGPRFKEALPYNGSRYPGAIVRGFERGNEVTIVLLRAEGGRWLYVGAQAREEIFKSYELEVFKPVTDSIILK